MWGVYVGFSVLDYFLNIVFDGCKLSINRFSLMVGCL